MRIDERTLKKLAKGGHAGARSALKSLKDLPEPNANSKLVIGASNNKKSLCARLAAQLIQIDAPEFYYSDHPLGEYQFHSTRKWRLDFYFPEYRVAIEVEGGVGSHRRKTAISNDGNEYVVQSRHLTPQGFDEDALKYFAAERAGISVIRVSSRMVGNDSAIAMAIHMLESRGWIAGGKLSGVYRSIIKF